VLGTGANGAALGADMIRAGLDVTFIDQWPENVEAMRTNGLIVRFPDGAVETTPINALHLCQVAELRVPFDIVFISVKSYDTRWSVELIKPALHQTSVVVGLQNGMTMSDVADVVGPERTVGAVLGIAANMFEPGIINRQVDRSGTWITVGNYADCRNSRIDQVREALSFAANTVVSVDIWSSKWMKLIANIPEMLPSAILGVPLLTAVSVDGVRAVMDQASREAYQLARELGVTMLPIFGKTADDVPDSSQYALDLLDAVLESYSLPDTRVAVLQDWDKGRRAELDAFNGYIVEQYRKKGNRAPVNEAILRLAERIESGNLSPGLDNAALLVAAGQVSARDHSKPM
jgi:2-dehydropantoate 2-reductase